MTRYQIKFQVLEDAIPERGQPAELRTEAIVPVCKDVYESLKTMAEHFE